MHKRSKYHGNRTNIYHRNEVDRIIRDRSKGGRSIGIPGRDTDREKREAEGK